MKTQALGSANKNATAAGRTKQTVRGLNPDRPGATVAGSRRTARGPAFAALSDELHRRLNPRGPIEALVVERVVDAAWRLQAATGRGDAGDLGPDEVPTSPKRTSAADRALRSFKEAIETLETLQSFPPVAAADPVAEASLASLDEVDPAVVAFDPFFDGDASDWNTAFESCEATPTGVPIWKDRLVFDFEVSDFSPVVKGTWVTVSHVVSLIVDGHSWADILRSHPELTQDDVHACMAYALDELNDPK